MKNSKQTTDCQSRKVDLSKGWELYIPRQRKVVTRGCSPNGPAPLARH